MLLTFEQIKSNQQTLIYIYMGNKQSKFQKLPSFPEENWQQISNPRARIKSDHGTYRLFRNNITNQEVQEYLMTINGLKQLQEFIQFCQWREREDSIVNTKFFNKSQDKQCCKDQYKAKVYIEHVPVRLSDIQDIPYPEYLYLLLSSLQGFEQLYQIIGYFRISEDFICMDKQGRVKVWLNSDLSKCYPLNSNLLDDAVSRQKTQALQEQMVTQIMAVIQANTIDEDNMETNVFEYIRRGRKNWNLTFRLAKQTLRNYAKQQKTQIPRFFQSVIGIFDDQPTPEQQQKFDQQNARFQSRVDPFKANKMYQKYDSDVRPTYVKSQRELRVYSQADVRGEGDWANNKILGSVPLEDELEYESGVRSPVLKITQIEKQPNFLSIPKAPQTTQKLPEATKAGSLDNFSKRVNFNYQGQSSNLNPIYVASPPMHNPLPTIVVVPPPLGRKLQSQSQFSTKNIITATTITGRATLNPNIENGKMIYSDSLSTYELDPELAQDLIRYRMMGIN